MNSNSAVADIAAKVTMKPDPNQSSIWPRSSTTSSPPRNVATSRKPTTSKFSPLAQSRSRFFRFSGELGMIR